MLPSGQIPVAYITIGFENAVAADIDLGHMTFRVEKEWLEQNSVHKWSVALHRYDPELSEWIALPTKRVKEDNTHVYYTVTITRFSTFAISGSQTIPPLTYQVADLEVSDDGIGFDPAVIPTDRLGMGTIQERAQAIGARLDIATAPGRGTRIAVAWSSLPESKGAKDK